MNSGEGERKAEVRLHVGSIAAQRVSTPSVSSRRGAFDSEPVRVVESSARCGNVSLSARVALLGLFTVLGRAHAPPVEPSGVVHLKASAPDHYLTSRGRRGTRRATRPAVASVSVARRPMPAVRPRCSNVCLLGRDNPDLPDSKGWVSWCERGGRAGSILLPSTSWRSNTLGPGTRAPWSFCASPLGRDPNARRQMLSVAKPACPEPADLDGTWEGSLGIVARQCLGWLRPRNPWSRGSRSGGTSCR